MAEPRELSAKERRAGLEFAGRLAKVALEAPDDVTKREVRKAIRAIESQYGYSQAEKRTRIMDLVVEGAASHAELIAESGFHRDDVYMIIAELQRDGLIAVTQLQYGSGGRPPVRIFPK
jgi:predicted Rossmann fold nucleotide-binding protein DprA/Smf involved in DNA uptake